MCGIVGICGAQDESWILGMNQSQFHRGPDENGIFRDCEADFSIGVRRLAIVDIKHGHQPMSTSDRRYTIIFNGEIFNAPELRAQLEKEGVEFMTDHSDTEVVLQLYARKEGRAVARLLNGMFAFAIYDREKKILFCARDHTGIKPFYYAEESGRFAFASELKSLLTLPFIKREINSQSLFHYMSLMYVPGEETIFQGIKRLPAGHCLTYQLKSKTLKIESWWKPNFEPNQRFEKLPISDLFFQLKEKLRQAILRWTISDVPLACSLSGGLDSSSIVGFLAEHGVKMKTYSLGFTGEREEEWNELPRARAVSKKLGTDHHELILKPESLLDDLLRMVWHLDEPYGGGLPSWTVFKFMAQDVKVGLTGTGGDELFGNYGKWRALERKRLFGILSRNGALNKNEFRKNFFERYYYCSDDEKLAKVFVNSHNLEDTSLWLYRYYESANASTLRDRIAATDLVTQLPEEFLMMTDRFSMAHSLEARTPFLDRELMEFVFSIPANIRTKHFNLKYLLRKAVADVLPPELVNAKKKGFVLPLKIWLRRELRPLVEYLLGREALRKQQIFRPEFYDYFVLPHLEGRADFTNVVWAAFMFQVWYFIFVKNSTVETPNIHWKSLVS